MKRSVWFLAAHEIKRYPVPGILTGLFFAMMGLMSGGIHLGYELSGERELGERVTAIQFLYSDWVILCVVSTLGFVYTRDYFSYYRSDTFSRRLAFYRKLPIGNKEILAARYLVMGTCLLAMSVCYYLPLYAMLQRFLTPGEGAGLFLVWTGYSIFAGTVYIYMELGYTGKQYLKLTFVVLLVLLLFLIVLAAMNIHIIEGTLDLVRRYGALPPILSLLASLAGAWGMARVTLRRLSARDLL